MLRGHVLPSSVRVSAPWSSYGKQSPSSCPISSSVCPLDNLLGWIQWLNLPPIDTMGYAFTFHVVSIFAQVPVGAYIHYPTISTDMLSRVKSRKRWHTNSDVISSSSVLSFAKLLCVSLSCRSVKSSVRFSRYYRIFMYYYCLSLRRASFLMANSLWTKNHIDDILHHSDTFLDIIHFLPSLFVSMFITRNNSVKTAQIVYPPCDTSQFSSFPLTGRERTILSVAQFR